MIFGDRAIIKMAFSYIHLKNEYGFLIVNWFVHLTTFLMR